MVRNMSEEKQDGRTMTPYIDAYNTPEFRNGKNTKWTFSEFIYNMKESAWEYAETSVGRQVLRNKFIAKLNEKFVVAIGFWGGKKYVLLCGEDPVDFEDAKCIEYDFPDEWERNAQ